MRFFSFARIGAASGSRHGRGGGSRSANLIFVMASTSPGAGRF